jgi:uncharacterized protein (TIRG00374 family)
MAGIKPGMSVRNLFSATILGYAANNVLPRVGELVRPIVIGRLEGVSRSSAFGTVIAERVLDFLTFSFMFCITLSIYPHAVDPFVEDPDAVRPWFFAGSLATTVIFFFLFIRLELLIGVADRVRSRFPGPFSEKVGKLLMSLRSGLDVSHLARQWFWVSLWSFVMWGLYALGMFASFQLFPDVAALSLDFGAAMVLLLISTIAWALPAPGAMGTYHSFLPAALTGLYGVDQVQALGMAIVTHEVGFLLVMVLGAYYAVRDNLSIRGLEASTNTSEGTHQ